MLRVAGGDHPDEGFASNVENEWFLSGPGECQLFVSDRGASGWSRSGELSTTLVHATYIQSVKHSQQFRWLLGGQWQRVESGVPPVFQFLRPCNRLRRWWDLTGSSTKGGRKARSVSGVYSDFQDIGGRNSMRRSRSRFPTPWRPISLWRTVECQRTTGSARAGSRGRALEVCGGLALSLWFPRPRLEYYPTEGVTLFAGANIVAGSFVVAEEFGRDRGRPDLGGQTVDFPSGPGRGGLRYHFRQKLAFELSGGLDPGPALRFLRPRFGLLKAAEHRTSRLASD